MNRRLRIKALLTAGTTCLALALVFVAANPVAHGYEMSVYDGYPWPFWALVVATLFLGQVVVFESFTDRYRHWKAGFALLLAANAILLFLPVLRYHMYTRGDMLTFIGMINQIGELGVVPGSNYYPNLHLLTLALSYATGLDVRLLVNVVPPIISLVYAVMVYALLRMLFDDARKLLFVVPVASLLLFTFENLVFSPSVFGFMLLPFVLAVAFRTDTNWTRNRFRLLFLFLVVSIVFYHPLTTLFYICVFVLLKAALTVGQRITGTSTGRISAGVITASLAFIVFFSWYYSFESIVGSTVTVLYYVLGAAQGSTAYGQITSVASRATPPLVDILLAGTSQYGLAAPITSLGTLFTWYLAYLTWRKRLGFDAITAFLGATLFVFTGFAVVVFFVDVPFGSTRPLRYVRFAGSILIGLGFYTLYRRTDGRAFRRYLRPSIYVTFFVLSFFSVFMLYGSPLSNSGNNQITQAEVEGMEWLFTNRDRAVAIDEMGISQFRVYSYLNRTNVAPDYIRRARYGTGPPDHFAYNNTTLVSGDSVASKRYLVVAEASRRKNPRFFPGYRRFWRHTPADFDRLQTDPTYFQTYDNGVLDTYLVRGIGNETAAPSRGYDSRFRNSHRPRR